MVGAVTPLNGADDFEFPIFCVNIQIDQGFSLGLAPHIFTVLESSPYLFFNKVSHTSLSIMLHRDVGIYMPTIFPSIFWLLAT